MEHPNELRQVRKTQSTARPKPPYSFEEETSIVARSIINVVQSSRIDPHPLVVALLEGYARQWAWNRVVVGRLAEQRHFLAGHKSKKHLSPLSGTTLSAEVEQSSQQIGASLVTITLLAMHKSAW